MTDRRETWTIERKITISGLVSIFTISGALLTIYVKMTERVNALEIALTYQKGVNDQIRDDQKTLKADTASAFSEVKSAITRLDGKVDRLLERR